MMVKSGRLFVPLDVNWYEEWGHTVSNEAALLWVLMLGAAKRMGSDGVLTLAQIERLAPDSMNKSDVQKACNELVQCTSPPVASDGLHMFMHGWETWNEHANTSEKGVFANHVRWHVMAQKPSVECKYCQALQRPNGDGGLGSQWESQVIPYIEEKRREEKSIGGGKKNTARQLFLDDFEECWNEYPRKMNRARALKTYVARRKAGVPKSDLLTATQNYAKYVAGTEQQFIKHGSTFFGSDEPFRDFLKPLDEGGSAIGKNEPTPPSDLFPSGPDGEAMRREFYGESVDLG